MVRFRTLGCYPLTGAIESDARPRSPRSSPKCAPARSSERQGRVIDHDGVGLDGSRRSRRAISDARRASTRAAAVAADDSAVASACAAASARAALHHLRLGRRRQVDADRPAALRLPAPCSTTSSKRSTAIRRSSARSGDNLDFALLVDGLSAEREQGITIDVAYRYFATRNALVHRRRHARPRAIYAQHGDRRLDRRSRRPARRRAQGPARRRRAATASSCRCSACATSSSRSTRWISSAIRRGRSSDAIEA